VVAGFIYHMTSPATKSRREERKADAVHREKMGEITAMERDLLYAESYLLAKQDTLDKAVLLAEIKKSQDAVEKSTRDSLRDQIGIRTAASNGGFNSNIDEMKARLAEMAKKLIEPTSVPTQTLPVNVPDPSQAANAPQAKIIPAIQTSPPAVKNELIRFTSKIDCLLNGQVINIGDELAAKKNVDRYDIAKPNTHFIFLAFANVSEEDFNTLRNGYLNVPEPAVVKGNGHSKTDPL